MATGVHTQYSGTIGRMFARHNVPALYAKQKAAPPEEPQVEDKRVDQVSLSPQAPKPLAGNLIREAFAAADALASGGGVSEEETTRLREDRVFAAVSALALLGYDRGEQAFWPGGIPAPTKAELEAARRRLAQRPEETAAAAAPETRTRRLGLLEKITGIDLEMRGQPS